MSPPCLSPSDVRTPRNCWCSYIRLCVGGPAGTDESGEGTERDEPPLPDSGHGQRLEEQEPGDSMRSFREIYVYIMYYERTVLVS